MFIPFLSNRILMHFIKQEKLNEYVHEATSNGYRLEIHVIGDGAAENALNAIEFAGVSPEKRPILTHCQVVQ